MFDNINYGKVVASLVALVAIFVAGFLAAYYPDFWGLWWVALVILVALAGYFAANWAIGRWLADADDEREMALRFGVVSLLPLMTGVVLTLLVINLSIMWEGVIGGAILALTGPLYVYYVSRDPAPADA